MSDLDKKLHSLLLTVDKDKPVAVFLDRNALRPEDVKYLSDEATGWPEKTVFVLIDGDPENDIRVAPLITGQEWYDRFEEEMDLFPFNLSGEISYNDAMDIARRAAGIEEEK